MADDSGIPEIITRKEALQRGLKRYFPGTVCKNGHFAARQTSNCACIECVKTNTRRYFANHPGKRTETWNKWATKQSNEWHDERRERDLARLLLHCELRPDLLKKRISDWQKRNRKRRNQTTKDWFDANPGKHGHYNALRRAAEANPSWADQEVIEQIYREANGVGLTVEHIVPIGQERDPLTADGYPIRGLHVAWNLRPLDGSTNSSKNDKMTRKDQDFCERNPYPGAIYPTT